MTNFYFNLNQIQSNPDDQPTVNRQSRLMSLSGKKAEKEQLSRDCLSLASELPLTCPRLDSLSLVSRQSDLDQVRAVSAAFSTRVWKHVAMIFAVLVLSIGQMWGTEYATSTFFQAVSKATTASITPTEANAGTGDFITKDCSEAFTITSGGSAVIGYYSTSNGTTAKTWEYSSSNGGLKSKDVKIWIVLYSSEQFVAGDSIVIANGNNSNSGAYTIVGAAANNTSDFHEVSAVVSPSTTTPAKNTNYYYILPNVFTSSNYLVIRNNNTGIYFGGIYAYHKAAPASSDSYDIHIGKNNADYTDESLTNTSGTTWSKTITLDAGSYYEFKVKKTPSAGDAVWYGNNGRIFGSVAAWDFNTSDDNCKLYTSVAGSYTFSWDASNNKLSVTYPAGEHPTKRVYMRGGESSWCGTANTKYFVHSWNSWGANEYDTQVQESTCDGYYADIIWYNDYFLFTRNSSAATAYNNNVWNYSQDLTYDSSKPLWTCTGYTDSKGNFTSSAYSPTTYTISYAAGSTTATGGAAISGSKANESKTCGVDFTLPSSAVFTATGYTQTGWTTSDGGAQTHALGGSYTDNAAQTFYPVWTVNNYDLTWNLAGGTTTSTGTGIGSGVSSNTTTSQAFGTALTAPTVTKTGYNFSAWSPSVASTMPAANTTYTAQWTAKTTTITIDANTANHGSTVPSPITATYGNALPSFTAATGASGYSLTGYFTAATSGTKVINADGSLVRNTTYATDESTPKWKSEAATLTLYAQYEAATPTVTATWPMVVNSAFSAVGTANNASITPSNATKAGTNIGDFNTLVDAEYTDYTGKMAKIPATGTIGSSGSVTDDHYIKYTITVASGYTFKPTGFSATVGRFATDNGYAQAVLKTGATTIKSTTASNPNRSGKSKAKTVYSASFNDASTYAAGTVIDLYIYLGGGMANGKSYGIVAVSITGEYAAAACSAPAAPTAFSAESITSTGATFSITDAGDAASYDIYYSTSGTAPNASTPATTTSTSKTKEVTGLTASTTYYAWVRSVCDDTHKSDWVALTGSSFETSAAAASQTALVINTLYEVPDMIPSGATLTDDDQFFEGLSANTKFELIGSASSSTTPKANSKSTNDKTIDGITFDDGSMWFKGNASLTSNIPTTFGLSFIVPEGGGKLYLYFSGTSTNIKLAKSGEAGSKPSCPNGYGEVDVTAGTYYLYGTGETSPYCFYGLKLCSTYSVSITTNSTTKTSGETGSTAAVNGKAYTATFTANTGYTLPSDVTVSIGGAAQTKGTGYTWTVSSGTGTLTVPAANVTGAISITVTGVAAESYSITYHCNGAESGCPSNVAAAYTLPSPLPTGLTKDGYDFGGWFTDSECTVAAVAGAALTGNTDLYAKWTEHVTSECITITDFETSNHSKSDNKPDSEGKYFYGYKGTKDAAHAVTITATNGDCIGVNSGAELKVYAGKYVNIYADNTTTGGTPATFSNVTSVSIDAKMINSSYYTTFDIKVGETTIADDVSLVAAKSSYQTFTYDGLAQLSGKIKIINNGSGSSYNFYADNIQICTADMAACTTPTLPTATLNDQNVCPGNDIAEWDATPTNASSITGNGESVSYSWKKKGSETVLGTSATLDLGSTATESQSGTYVVTVTVSKAGYASATVSKELELSVTAAVEEPVITSNKATVYPGNSVTLTATCGTDGVTWNWYLCANADGTGAGSSLGTSSSYTIASAPAAGTYYYKAVATGTCGSAEHVYTLTVTAASECENYFWFIYADDATTNGVINNRDDFFSNTSTGSGNGGTYKITIDEVDYTSTKRLGAGAYKPKFTVPESKTATLYVYGKANSADAGKHLVIKRTSDETVMEVTDNNTDAAYSLADIPAGEWTLSCGNNNWRYAVLAVKLCGASSCTDATPTITAANTTVCVGSELSISSTGYETGATFQWQKLNSSTSTWDNISGATSATYTVATAAAEHAGSYRLVATKECARTSNTVTISVPSAPNFGSTVPASVSVMQTLALSISTVEASDAVSYKWYKSANNTWDAGDTEIGTDKTLIKAYADEAIGSPSYYVFCRAQNSCGITTSSAIAVNVTTYVEEDCATKGNEGEAEFGFENTGCSDGSIESTACYTSNSRSKYLTYTAPDGKYFNKAKVTVAVSSGSKCGYAYSTDGSTWTYAELTGLSGTLTEKTIELTGNITHFRISRNLQDGSSVDHGVTSGTFYLSKACFEYTESCTATEVVRSTGSASYDYTYPAAFAKPTFALQKASDHSALAGTLTYSSSNEDIATVDDDGDVDFTGLTGTVTITVAFAGGTISTVDYCASQTTYTITVNCSDVQPKITTSGSSITCQASITLNAVQQSGSAFADGTFQWYRDGVEIEGATSASYTATRAGIYTVSRTATCTKMSSNSANITSDNTEPEVTRLTPFQYYHVDSVYRATSIMRYRHLFTVKGSTAYGSTGKNFKMELSRNGGDAVDVTTQSSIVVTHSADNTVDTVLLDLNALKGKYTENDELVLTCKAIACGGAASETYKESITVYVINKTKPTMALICSGAKKDGTGTRKTSEMTVGGDFLTGYNPADLCQQTGNTSFDASQEWGLYTKLKENYIVTPVNGYANFYKLNYEPFDILFLTDYPKASKSDAAATILDDMADLCDYRPLFSFKTHMVHKTPSKWVAKGFTTAPEVPKNSRLRLNIVCYAHPMFEDLKTASATNQILHDADDGSQLVYTMLREAGYEKKDNVKKGIQGFEIDAAENFVTIGLVHYNATAADSVPDNTHVTWTPGSGDRLLVAAAERQANLEARMILFSLNAGAHSKLNTTGENVVLKCLEYLLTDAEVIAPADCSLTFDNNGGSGDGLWSTATNWAPNRLSYPGRFNSARIAAPVTVDMEHAEALELRIVEGGSVTIPAGKALEVTSTVRRMDGHEISPTENEDIFIGSNSTGNGTLIFNNNTGDSKATVAMYTTAKTADPDPVTGKISAAASTWQYIGTPHNDVASATYNYYDSWLYQYDTDTEGWTVIPNGGPLVPFRGYCVTHPEANHTFVMGGKLTATTSQEIAIPAGKFVVVANSWTAPIYVKNITAEDMENTREQTIYFFNTGSDSEQTGTVANGTYVAVPVHASSYTGDSLISSMQGFYVVGGSSDGTLHLDYERHVRPTNNRNIKSGPMHAPQHYAVDDEPIVAKLFFRGSRYSDRLVVLERADFSRGFDNGWDGEAWGGNDAAPYSCVSGENRWDAVSAIPDFEGTVVGFQAGEDNEYRIDFEYSEENEPLYLLDTDNNTYTRVLTGNTYQFTTSDKDYHDRFLFTRMAPQVATGYENLDGGEGAKAKKLLIEDKMYIMVNGMLYDATGKVVK